MKPSVHDEEKLIYTLNRLKMSTIIYYYIDVGGGLSICQHSEMNYLHVNCGSMMELAVGIRIYLILILSILGVAYPSPPLPPLFLK